MTAMTYRSAGCFYRCFPRFRQVIHPLFQDDILTFLTGDVAPEQRYHGFERWPSVCELHQTVLTRPKLALQRPVYHTVRGPEILDFLRSRLDVEIVGGVFGREPLRKSLERP